MDAGAKLHSALKASRDDARVQRRRLRWTAAIAASYALDTLFLGLFAASGAVPGTVALGYGTAAALLCALTACAYRAGWNLRARDPELAEPQIIAALVLQLAVVWSAPQIAFPYLCNIFTVFAFGMISLSVRDALVIWALTTAGGATVLYAVADRLGMPLATPGQLVLVWVYFSIILARFVMLSVYSSGLRARLAESRRRLAATLDQVQQLISHDELTRALNRRSVVARLVEEKNRCERDGATFSLALMDLDHFKKVNDTFGHAAGDEVLRAFAAAVHDSMRTSDVFGRYGGEEFLLVLVGAAPREALDAVERIRAAVSARDWRAIVPDFTVTISTGISGFSEGDSIEQLLHRADQALYQAKHEGRNRTIVSQP